MQEPNSLGNDSPAPLGTDRRGAILVEMLAVLPLFTILWSSGIGAFEANRDALAARQKLRLCALAYAMGGCQTTPAGCLPEPGPALRAAPPALTGALATLAIRLPLVARVLTASWPNTAVSMSVAGSEVPAGFPMLCDPLPVTITPAQIHAEACAALGGPCR